MGEVTENGWNEWSNHVLKELERLTASNENMRESLEIFKVDITRELAKKSDVEAIQREVQDMKIKHLQEISSIKEEFNKKISDSQALNVDKRAEGELHNGIALATLKSELSSQATMRGAIAGAIPALVSIVIIIIGYLLKTLG